MVGGGIILSSLNCCELGLGLVFFFFSSRRRHTILQGDWSSDVCSSDLALRIPAQPLRELLRQIFVTGGAPGQIKLWPGPGFIEGSGETVQRRKDRPQIGRASCRERV